jgi:hypothetical protein
VLGGETPGGVQDRVADRAPVLVDGLAPQLRHGPGTLAPSIGGLPVLVVTALSTYKPRGLTRYGWRRQQAERGRRREEPSASMP